MDKERRRQALTLYLYYLNQDIEGEKKAVSGMQKLVDAYSRQHEFADRDAIEDAKLEARQVALSRPICRHVCLTSSFLYETFCFPLFRHTPC